MLTACNVCHRLLVKPNENIIRRILDLLDKKPVPIPKGWRVCLSCGKVYSRKL